MFIKVNWYDGVVREAVLSSSTDAHSLCQALEMFEYTAYWNIDKPEGSFPWYQEKLWSKCKPKWEDWKL